MKAIQCKHPSESEYTKVRLIDPVEVEGKHYAVAVDVYNKGPADIFLSFMNVLNRNDEVTLITFGHHSQVSHYCMKDDYTLLLSNVKRKLSRKETGLSTLVGMRRLEQIDADIHIMMTDFKHDFAPYMHTTTEGTLFFRRFDKVGYDHRKEFYFFEDKSHEEQIRKILKIQQPQYYDITLEGHVTSPAIPHGGQRDIELPYGVDTRIRVHYMTCHGQDVEVICSLEDDASLPFQSNIMKSCAMVE